MFYPIIYKDIDFTRYFISPDCRIMDYNTIIDDPSIFYNSSNGNVYVLLQNFENIFRLYQLDLLMLSTFRFQIRLKWEHFKAIHLDGNLKNCNLDNLSCEEDVEEWRDIIYPDYVARNLYKISSWGRIKNINTGLILKNIKRLDGYLFANLVRKNISRNKVRFRPVVIHQLAGLHFITNPDESYKFINHIDGDKTNNHIMNLEWCDTSMNCQHSIFTQLKSSKITTEEIDMVIALLLNPDNKRSIKIVYDQIDHIKYPNITYWTVDGIKRKDITYIRRDSKYDLKNIYLGPVEKGARSQLSTKDVDMIIEMLLSDDYGGSPSGVYNALDHNKYPYITRSVIDHIKRKGPGYIRSDSKYDLQKIEFPKCR